MESLVAYASSPESEDGDMVEVMDEVMDGELVEAQGEAQAQAQAEDVLPEDNTRSGKRIAELNQVEEVSCRWEAPAGNPN
jgi:hypothetical protein